jgi:hypothetical protein
MTQSELLAFRTQYEAFTQLALAAHARLQPTAFNELRIERLDERGVHLIGEKPTGRWKTDTCWGYVPFPYLVEETSEAAFAEHAALLARQAEDQRRYETEREETKLREAQQAEEATQVWPAKPCRLTGTNPSPRGSTL